MRVSNHAVSQYRVRFEPDAEDIKIRRKLVKLARRAVRHGGRGKGKGLPRAARVIEDLDLVLIVIRDTVVTVHRIGTAPEYPQETEHD